jgi:hypothetical protein
MDYIVNLTTEEYIVSDNLNERNQKLKQLVKKHTRDTAIVKEDINESRWKRDDKIVIAPENTFDYVIKHYSLINI